MRISRERVSFLVMVCSAFVLFSFALLASASSAKIIKNEAVQQVVQQHVNPNKAGASVQNFAYEPNLDNAEYIYIIELNELAIAQEPNAYRELQRRPKGRLSAQEFSQTNRANNVNLNAVARQLNRVKQQQSAFLQKARTIKTNIKTMASYQYAVNGIALKLTQNQAQALSMLPEVKSVQRSKTRRLDTDRGPTLIGAPRVWNGSAFATIPQTQGEGIVVAILDSGVNTDHPSFAEVAGDGYIHTNPLGNGIYLGDCAAGFPQLCNNKLIGVYSYTSITDAYGDTSVFPPGLARNGEDYDGHGSHVASTAAGNVLFDVDELTREVGETRGSGIPTGFEFEQISGVAPRANIISYQVCYPGSSADGDTYAACVDAAILDAIDDAISDNVDVINYSISGGGDPWSDITERAFLRARNSGIFVATSAGNSGPDAQTSEKHAPWYTSVAASEHGRENIFAKQLQNFSGGTSVLGTINGQSNSGSVTAPIVYAGDFTNPNDPLGDSGDCLESFPSATFSGQIVVCNRGDIPRVDKARNVAAGGAGGFVLVNIEGGQTFLANDEYVVPGIHINAADGESLKAWLNTGSNHRATITLGEPRQSVDTERVDVLASFSSRGPNTTISTLAPTVTAPGVNIYAAYADENLGRDGQDSVPAPSDFSYLDGTSMSSPHVAGSAALLKAAHPTWGPDEIRSALSLTATSAVRLEDAQSDATFIDMGAGRIQVDQAVATGLIMSETSFNYATADPDLDGDPRTLNLPSITDTSCAGICTWERTVTATTDATWQATGTQISTGINITVSPSAFTLEAGQSQTLSITIDSLEADKNVYTFGSVTLSSAGLPDANIPISVISTIGEIPAEVDIQASRDIDSQLLDNLDGITIDDLVLETFAPVKASQINETLAQDPTANDYLDELSGGTHITVVEVSENTKRFVSFIETTTSPDIDLFVLRDSDDDGEPSITEEIARSNSGSSDESIMINNPEPGRYFIVVQNFSASSSNLDTFEMRYAVVDDNSTSTSLDVDAPAQLDAAMPFDMRFIYDLGDSQDGDDYFAAVGVKTDIDGREVALIAVNIERVEDDVRIGGMNLRANPGDSVPLNVRVNANDTNEDRDYLIMLSLPVGTEFTNFSTSNNGQLINNQVQWEVSKVAGDPTDTILNFQLGILDGALPGPITVEATSELTTAPIESIQNAIPFMDLQVEGPPSIDLNGSNTTTLSVIESQTLTIPLIISEPNADSVSVVWTQTEGPSATVIEQGNSYSLVAPRVSANSTLRYTVEVSDPNNQSATGTVIVNVINNAEPIINSIDVPAAANGGQSISLTVDASDPENDGLQISVNGSIINGNSASLRTPTSGTSVSYRVDVSDGISTTSQTVSVSLTQTTPTSSDGGGGGGTLPLLLWLVFPIAVYRRLSARKLNT